MLQYFINATAIWLISIILFDVFLRRESYHNYNRFYLLFTFILGALLPLWQLQHAIYSYSGTLRKPIEEVIIVKRNIVAASTPAASGTGWQQWLVVVYAAGVIIALFLLVADVVKLLLYYRNGVKTVQGKWTIVSTGKSHAPFSFRNTLFISSRDQYNDEEWSMIIIHERRHTCLLHIADLLLMQCARIVFWFHPLVYIYNKRLLLVHEYQADNAAAQQPKVYGSFLVEQAMLQTAPSIAHSFNRSPIKNRIIMLTRRSTKSSKIKMMVLIPLVLTGFGCFTKNRTSQKFEQKGNSFTYPGTQMEFSKPITDSTVITDDETGKKDYQVMTKASRPVKMNGHEIQYTYTNEQGTSPEAAAKSGEQFYKYLIDNLRPLLEKLEDGQYTFSPFYATVNESGQLAYYELNSITKTAVPFPGVNGKQIMASMYIDSKIKKAIDEKVASLTINCPKFKTLYVNNTAVPYELSVASVVVKGHKLNQY